jgi:hypothetical protein
MPAPVPQVRFALQQFEDNVLLLRWNDQLSVTADDVSTLAAREEIVAADEPPLLLVELNGMTTLSRQAFGVFATGLKVAAVACVGTCPVEQVLVTHFKAVHQPPYPVAYLANHAEALHWLHSRRSADAGNNLDAPRSTARETA